MSKPLPSADAVVLPDTVPLHRTDALARELMLYAIVIAWHRTSVLVRVYDGPAEYSLETGRCRAGSRVAKAYVLSPRFVRGTNRGRPKRRTDTGRRQR